MKSLVRVTKDVRSTFTKLEGSIIYLETFVYLMVLCLIIRSLIMSVYDFFVEPDENKWYEDTKLNFSYTISVSLSAILLLEVLKLFYIKTAHQIFIVSGITILKLVINYFVESDLKELRKDV